FSGVDSRSARWPDGTQRQQRQRSAGAGRGASGGPASVARTSAVARRRGVAGVAAAARRVGRGGAGPRGARARTPLSRLLGRAETQHHTGHERRVGSEREHRIRCGVSIVAALRPTFGGVSVAVSLAVSVAASVAVFSCGPPNTTEP